ERPPVRGLEVPLEGDAHLAQAGVDDLAEEAPERLREVEPAAERLERVGVEAREVQRVQGQTALLESDDALRELGGDLALRLLRRGPEVRRQDDARVLAQRAALGQRLLLEDVEGGAGELAARQGLEEGLLLDQLAASAVDQPRAL